MGTLYRSELMQLVQLFVQVEAAHDTVDELGKLGVLEFRDMNADVNAFQRNFVREVKQMDEMERQLRFFEEQVRKEGVGQSAMPTIITSANIDTLGDAKLNVDELQAHFVELERELVQINTNQETLMRQNNELIELKHVLTKDAAFFLEAAPEVEADAAPMPTRRNDDAPADYTKESEHTSLLGAEHPRRRSASAASSSSRMSVDHPAPQPSAHKPFILGSLTGVLMTQRVVSFERVLWRASRGNMFLRHAPLEHAVVDPHTGEEVFKSVFIIFFQGNRLQSKIKKICEAFNANIYLCPQSPSERNALLDSVRNTLTDLEQVMGNTRLHRRQVLTNIDRNVVAWKSKVAKEKGIYHAMNQFDYDYGHKWLIAEAWCPVHCTGGVQNALRVGTERSGAQMPSILRVIDARESPPTHFPTNKFTSAFQEIVNAYGMARYREVNPAVFAIISFPFLFAVMFGDVGHGVLLTLFSLYLVRNEKKMMGQKMNEMIAMAFGGRYMLLLMGLFSMYTGLIYNDMFAVSLNLFGSNYSTDCVGGTCPILDQNKLYPFGMDPAWKGADNELVFYNSFKMKISIIFGVTQMMTGIIISGLNCVFFRNHLTLFCEFIPQVIFLTSTFGYMSFLIMLKWVQRGGNAPKIMNVMIGMFLKPLSFDPTEAMFSYQREIQWALLGLAFISVPWMLCVKPFILRRRMKARARYEPVNADEGEDAPAHGEHEEESFGDIFVHQVIHTIEFVLGAVSNTASYLRLWALSLAHAQLSTVFWDQVLLLGLGRGNPIFAFVGFGAWLVATFAVLMVLESLSAFLHALRLHWVEFQNKFYIGDGRRFTPFSYVSILEGTE